MARAAEVVLRPNEIVLLCVDDEEIPLTLRKLVLQKQGYQVLTANSATNALEVLNSHHVDLVLSDQLMPGVTGIELTKKIKQLHPDLQVVLVSGVNEIPEDAEHADLFISKVEGPRAMFEKIAALLTKQGLIS